MVELGLLTQTFFLAPKRIKTSAKLQLAGYYVGRLALGVNSDIQAAKLDFRNKSLLERVRCARNRHLLALDLFFLAGSCRLGYTCCFPETYKTLSIVGHSRCLLALSKRDEVSLAAPLSTLRAWMEQLGPRRRRNRTCQPFRQSLNLEQPPVSYL